MESRDKVAQQQDFAILHTEKVPEKLWHAIVKMHKVDCVRNVKDMMDLAARKAY